MAEKHKSKYKKPENAKPKYRKDIDNYTHDDKDGKSNPFSTKEKQLNVLRKTDKEFVDTGDLYVKYNADDRLYKDVEEGEYNPKHAAKVLKKRQDDDEKLSKDQIKDKIENLTREGKERFIREYISRKLRNQLVEQETPDDTTPPTDDIAPEAPAAPTPAPEPAATPTEPAEQKTPEEELGISLQSKNVFDKVGSILSVVQKSLETSLSDPKSADSVREFYKFLLNDLVKQRQKFIENSNTKK